MNPKPRLLLILTCLSLVLISCKPRASRKDAYVQKIIQYNRFEPQFVGLTAEPSQQWFRWELVSRMSTEEDLINYTDHYDPKIRAYAFQDLVDRKSKQVFKILLKHISDTAIISVQFGCMTSEMSITDFYLDAVGYMDHSHSRYELSKGQERVVDSLLLFGDEIKSRDPLFNVLTQRSRSQLIRKLEPESSIYFRVRELVENGVFEALPLLAQYQNDQDIELIIKYLLIDKRFEQRNSRFAVVYFPHPSFYSYLKEQLLYEIGKNRLSDPTGSFPLYLALAQYHTLDTRELFIKALKMSPDDEYQTRVKFIFKAIKWCPSPVFENILPKAVLNNLED